MFVSCPSKHPLILINLFIYRHITTGGIASSGQSSKLHEVFISNTGSSGMEWVLAYLNLRVLTA